MSDNKKIASSRKKKNEFNSPSHVIFPSVAGIVVAITSFLAITKRSKCKSWVG